jgi:hypothetical protein
LPFQEKLRQHEEGAIKWFTRVLILRPDAGKLFADTAQRVEVTKHDGCS